MYFNFKARSLSPGIVALTLGLLFSSLTPAQIKTGRLDGDVQDATGSSVTGATVTAVETQTQATNSSKTTNEGHFTFPSLQPGIYTLTVESAGFRKAVLTNIQVTVADTVNEIVKLEIGSVSDSVTVEATGASVQTTDSSISSAISMKEVDLLPQINRSPITLSIFQPGVQIDIRAGQDSSFSHVNGLRQGSNNSTLDGIDANDSLVPRLGLTLTANNSDSVEEFRGVTAGGSAEFGRSAGEQVSLITRSGTNEFHGNAYDYLRNTDLNANDFFNNQAGTPTPKFIKNLFGGSFGGPIVHNKFFIFGNYQGSRTKQDTIRTRTVPTATALQGIFQYRSTTNGPIQSLNVASYDPLHIGIDPAVAKLFSLYPAPNTNSVGDGLNTAGYTFNNPTPSLDDQFTIKGDYRPSDKHAVFLRWSWQRNTSIDGLNSADATFPGQAQGSQGGHRWGFASGYTWTISPTLINEFTAGYQSATVDFLRPGRPSGPALQSNSFTDIAYTGFTQGRNSPVIDFVDNLSKVLGNHTLKIGTNVRSTKQYGYNYGGAYPTLLTTPAAGGSTIPTPAGLNNGQLAVFQNLYNDLLGRVTQINQTYNSADLSTLQPIGSPRVRNFRLNESGYYLQDDWHVTKRLTLNLGVRYEVFGQPHEINGIQGVANVAGLMNGINQTSAVTIQKGASYYGNDFNNFAPRFGFAFDPYGDGKTAVRGFYGIYYDRAVGAVINGIDGNTPGFATATNTFPDAVPGTDVRYSSNPSPIAPAGPTVTPPLNRNTTIYLANPNLRTGYVQSFGFNVQHELPSRFLMTVGYVGTRGVKLFMDRDVNQPRISPDFQASFNELAQYAANTASPVSPSNFFVKLYGTPALALSAVSPTNLIQGKVGTVINTVDRTTTGITNLTKAGYSNSYFRNYPQFNQVVLGTNDGRSAYDSLQVTLHRSTKSLSFSVNYTWSKSIDNVSNEGNGFSGVGSGIPIDSYNLGLNRSVSDYDRPHSVNSTAVFSIPVGQGRTYFGNMPRWADTLIGGWDIGSLAILQSGQPFSVSSQRATTPVSGVSNTYANYSGTDVSIGGVNKLSDGVYFFTPAQVAQFSYPGAFQIGNAGRNIFRNPAFYEVDASLSKRFKLTERHSFSLRGEAYNLFNHPNFGLSSTNLNINTPTTFGKFSSTLGTQVGGSSARLLQVSARYEF